MSLGAKQVMMKSLETQLADILTLSNLNSVMDIFSKQLGQFEVEEITPDSKDSNSLDFLSAFLNAKQLEGRSKKTIDRYRYILTKMIEDVKVPISDITVYTVRSYLMTLKAKGLSDKTLEGIRSVLSSFFIWLEKEKLLKDNPISNINPIRCAKKIRLPFSDVDIEKLKEFCTTSRDKAIINFLLSTGCRISEVCELDIKDIDLQNLECKVHGKGNKERTVYIDNVTSMLLKRYLDGRKDTSDALFVGKGSERLTPGGVRARLNRIADKAGVENVHPHRFRRTLATNLIIHGMPIQEVACILGHDKIDTTMTYVYIEKENVKNAYRKFV